MSISDEAKSSGVTILHENNMAKIVAESEDVLDTSMLDCEVQIVISIQINITTKEMPMRIAGLIDDMSCHNCEDVCGAVKLRLSKFRRYGN